MKLRNIVVSILMSSTFLLPSFVYAKANTLQQISNGKVVSNEFENKKLLQQRQIYSQLQQLLKEKASSTRDIKIAQLLYQLKDYPLYSYAKFQVLSQQKSPNLEEIKKLQKTLPGFLTTKYLKQKWLMNQQKQGAWKNIQRHQGQIPKTLAVRCIIKNANFQLHKQGNKQHQLQQLEKMGVANLWLSGKNLPNSCTPLFNEWQRLGGMTNARIYQRSILAFEQNNTSVLRHLANLVTNSKTKKAINDLLKLQQNPKLLTSNQNQFSINRLSSKSKNDKKILMKAYPAFVRKLSEQDINPKNPFALPAQWAKKFHLTAAQKRSWEILMLSHFFDSKNPQIQQWRDKTVLSLKSDKQTARRIRVAIREHKNIDYWIKQLSAKGQNKSEWRYWQAEMLWQKGQKQAAKKIFTQLQQGNRGFYPMLAAEKLNLTYKPVQKEFNHPELVAKLKKRYAKDLILVNELRATNESGKLYSAWIYLLSLGDNSHKLALSKIAEENEWFDLQVEGTIQAKAWAYLPLRLPNAYLNFFKTVLKNKQIRPTFAMAIARQESGWKPGVSSHANARGLMQLLPSTAKRTAQRQGLPYKNVQQLFMPFHNIMLGTAHLQELYELYGDNRILMAAAYNAGAHRVKDWLNRSKGNMSMAEFIATIPFYETRGYVQNVLTYDYYYQGLQGRNKQKFTQAERSKHY